MSGKHCGCDDNGRCEVCRPGMRLKIAVPQQNIFSLPLRRWRVQSNITTRSKHGTTTIWAVPVFMVWGRTEEDAIADAKSIVNRTNNDHYEVLVQVELDGDQ